MLSVLFDDRGLAVQVGEEIAQVCVGHPGKRAIRKGREVGSPARCAPMSHGPDEVRLAPVTDSRRHIRADIRAVEGTKGGLDPVATSVGSSPFFRVARSTAAESR